MSTSRVHGVARGGGADETPGKKRVATRTDSDGGDGLPWGYSEVTQSQERPERTEEEGPFR